jgi:hypothetical protein
MTALGDLATTSPTEQSWLRFYKTAARQWNKLEPRQRDAIGEMFTEVRREAEHNRQHSRVRHVSKGEEGKPALYSINPRVNGRELRVLYVQALGAYCVLNIIDGFEKDNGVSARNTELYKSVAQARWAALAHPEAFVSYPPAKTDEPKETPVPQMLEQGEQTTDTPQRPTILTLEAIPRGGCGHLTAWLLRTLAKHPANEMITLVTLHTTIPRKLAYTDVIRLQHVGLATVKSENHSVACAITDFGREVAALEPTRIVVTGDHSMITLFKDAREDPFVPGFIGTALTARHIVLTALQVVTADGEYIAETALYDLLDKRDQVLVPSSAFYQVLRSLVQDGIAESRYVHIGGTTRRCEYRSIPAHTPEPPPTVAEDKEETHMPTPATVTTPRTAEAGLQQAPLAALLQTAEGFCEALGQAVRSLPRGTRTDAVALLEAVEDFIARARDGNG